MSSQVPREIPVGRAVRYAVQIEGATWIPNAAVSKVPRPTRPAAMNAAISTADHAVISAAAVRVAVRRQAGIMASTPARMTADKAGTSAPQNLDSTK